MSDRYVSDVVVQSPYQEALMSRYLLLKSKIRKEQSKPASPDYYLKQLKKEKLVLKEKLLLEQDNDNARKVS
ncbi:MAG: DUF465 domain-containing protein [Alphaproteobacteria bacterium]|nr:DUF465 domain-containing protein [Alphaproteobacteria bacterium]